MSSKNTLTSFLDDSNKHDEYMINIISPGKSPKSSARTPQQPIPSINLITHKAPSLIYSHQFQEERRLVYSERNINKKIQHAYNLIVSNKEKLLQYVNTGILNRIANDTNSFHLYLDYFYNFLLLFTLLMYNNDKANAKRTLAHLREEMKKEFNIDKYIGARLTHKAYKYSDDVIEYITFSSSLLQCTLKLNAYYIYESSLIRYLTIIESIQDSRMLCAYAYFYTGCLLVESDSLNASDIAFDLAYSRLVDLARRLRATNFLVSALINRAFVVYVHRKDGNVQGPLLLNEAKRVKQKELNAIEERMNKKRPTLLHEPIRSNSVLINEMDNQLIKISLGLIEMEVLNDTESSKRVIREELKYITENVEQLDENDRKIVYYVMQRVEEDIYKGNSIQKNDDEFINYCLLPKTSKKSAKEVDIKEFEKLFLFLTTLSVYQIDLLNQEQPYQKDPKKFKSLPIYLSNIFKQSLNLEQLDMLNQIKIFNLSRKSILKNVSGQISLENLDLSFLYQSNQLNVLNNEITGMKNVANIVTKMSQFDTYIAQNQATQKKEEKKKDYGMLMRSDSMPDFRYQNKLPYEIIKNSLKKYFATNPNALKGKNEDILKDSVIIGLLNKMSLREIKVLNDNPLWLVEILDEYREKMEQDENSEEEKSEEKVTEKVEEESKEKEEETFSEKNDNEQKQNKSIELIDAMNMGKDE